MTVSIIKASGLTRAVPDTSQRRRGRVQPAGKDPAGDCAHPVLAGMDLTVTQGESVAIVGPSGTGKTTLLNILNGLLQPDAGKLEVFGRDTATLGANGWARWRRNHIATVFQDANLIPTLSLGRNVAFRSALAGCPDVEGERAIMDALGIGRLMDRYPDEVSGGERQRGAVAAAFAMKPRLLLADEPTGSLDETSSKRVAELLFGGIRERQLTAVIATHNLEFARQCDRVLQLSGGRLRPVSDRDAPPT